MGGLGGRGGGGQEETVAGGGGGGGEGTGWQGLSQAEHIVQAIWSLEIAAVVEFVNGEKLDDRTKKSIRIDRAFSAIFGMDRNCFSVSREKYGRFGRKSCESETERDEHAWTVMTALMVFILFHCIRTKQKQNKIVYIEQNNIQHVLRYLKKNL